jgi:DNA-binding response OmpR family regulator
MAPEETNTSRKVLLVDDDDSVRELMTLQLVRKGFKVVTAASVTEALGFIATETFDVLVTDLNMPNAGDGFTVLTAMRHSQPHVLILLVSGYPDVDRAMATIALEADEIIVKPFDSAKLPALISEKMLSRNPAPRVDKQSVSVILHRCRPRILADWLTRAKSSPELNHLNLADNARTGYLPKLIEDLVARLSKPNAPLQSTDALFSRSALEHGEMRFHQGYSAAMLVHESRILQVTLFETLQSNLNFLDFSLLLPDVMKIADEVDAQLTQAMASFTEAQLKESAA